MNENSDKQTRHFIIFDVNENCSSAKGSDTSTICTCNLNVSWLVFWKWYGFQDNVSDWWINQNNNNDVKEQNPLSLWESHCMTGLTHWCSSHCQYRMPTKFCPNRAGVSNSNSSRGHIWMEYISVGHSFWIRGARRAALRPLAGLMWPAGRVFETPLIEVL